MLAQRCLVPRQQSIQVLQEEAGGVPSFIKVASLACFRHLDYFATEDARGVALHQDAREPSARHANQGAVAVGPGLPYGLLWSASTTVTNLMPIGALRTSLRLWLARHADGADGWLT